MQIVLDMPRTKEELHEIRKKAMMELTTMYRTCFVPEISCDNCSGVSTCMLAYDLYNIDGDCLAEK